MLEFEKYNGTTDPIAHLCMYCRKMTGYKENEKLLIRCFRDSLIGATLQWYKGLDPIRIQTWIDLSHAFLDQYKHVLTGPRSPLPHKHGEKNL